MNLLQKQQLFSVMTAKLIEKASELGFGLTLGEAWRSDETANLMAQEGKGICKSDHRTRLAIDVNLIQNGNFLTDLESYRALGQWWTSQSTDEIEFCWGGNFPKPDADHFSFENNGIR